MNHAFAIIALGQVPQPLIDEGLRSFDGGGFKAVAAIAIAGWIATAFAAWRLLLQKDKQFDRERDANAAALKAAQDQAVSVGVFMADIKNALLRVADGLQQVSHRIEDIAP